MLRDPALNLFSAPRRFGCAICPCRQVADMPSCLSSSVVRVVLFTVDVKIRALLPGYSLSTYAR